VLSTLEKENLISYKQK